MNMFSWQIFVTIIKRNTNYRTRNKANVWIIMILFDNSNVSLFRSLYAYRTWVDNHYIIINICQIQRKWAYFSPFLFIRSPYWSGIFIFYIWNWWFFESTQHEDNQKDANRCFDHTKKRVKKIEEMFEYIKFNGIKSEFYSPNVNLAGNIGSVQKEPALTLCCHSSRTLIETPKYIKL